MASQRRVPGPSARPTAVPDDVARRLKLVPNTNPGLDVFVYVIASDRGRISLGVSGNPGARLVAHQRLTPSMLRLAFVARTASNGYAIERGAADLLRERHLSGDWFETTSAIAELAIKAAAEQLEARLDPVDLEDICRTQYVPVQGIWRGGSSCLEDTSTDVLSAARPLKVMAFVSHFFAYVGIALVSAGPLYALFKITAMMRP